MTDYEIIVAGIGAALRTVPGLTVLDYEPNALHQSPAAYTRLGGFDRGQSGQVTSMLYRVIARVCVKWQDNPKAEAQLASLINPVCASIDVDATLGGITSGMAQVTTGEATYATIGDALYRVCDVTISATSKGGYKSGI